MAEAFDRGPQTSAEGALFWRSMVERGTGAAGGPLGPDRYLEIRYEELVDDPARWSADVCDFLGIDTGRADGRARRAPRPRSSPDTPTPACTATCRGRSSGGATGAPR